MSECPNVSDVTTGSLVLNILLMVAVAGSYVPQHVRIIRLRSSEGISPWYLLLGGMSSFCTFFNSLLKSLPLFGCVHRLGAKYVIHLLAFFQLGLQLLSFSLIIVLYVVFFPAALKYINDPAHSLPSSTTDLTAPASDRPSAGLRLQRTQEWRNCLAMLATICSFIVVVSAMGLGVYAYGTVVKALMVVLSFLAIGLNITQYVPQILQVWRTKRIGAFSIPMMCIQTPGGVVMAAMLSQSESGRHWTAWVPFLVAALMQGILLVLCIMNRKNRPADMHVPITSRGRSPSPAAHEREDAKSTPQGLYHRGPASSASSTASLVASDNDEQVNIV
jgi:uncharacterized protein with PQ loop repeat